MEQISQIHYAEPFPFSFHSSLNGVIFDKIYRKLIGKNTPDRFFIRIFALFGYKYLVCAIVISMQDSYLLNGVTTKLCPEIARRYGINPDSGGPGRWRGGCGVVREMEVLAKEAILSIRLDAIRNPPWGTNGGMQAGTGRCVVNPGRPDERELPPLSDGNIIKRGDIIRVETGGGGGWGHPFDREPARVLADVRGGFVSRASAERDYGVIPTADGRAVDEVATAKRRADRPPTKLFHRHGYAENLA